MGVAPGLAAQFLAFLGEGLLELGADLLGGLEHLVAGDIQQAAVHRVGDGFLLHLGVDDDPLVPCLPGLNSMTSTCHGVCRPRAMPKSCLRFMVVMPKSGSLDVEAAEVGTVPAALATSIPTRFHLEPAAIQCLIGTARLNSQEAAAWLRETREKPPAWPNSRIDERLPLRGVTKT